jgi:hypothetical protein
LKLLEKNRKKVFKCMIFISYRLEKVLMSFAYANLDNEIQNLIINFD